MKELAFPDIQDAPALSVTGALTDLLAYALGDLEISGSSAALRGRFAERLGELIAASDVRIIGTPVLATPVADSVCLTVPASDGSRQFLQVVFDADRELGATDFALLQAAASLAAVVLQLEKLPHTFPGRSYTSDGCAMLSAGSGLKV